MHVHSLFLFRLSIRLNGSDEMLTDNMWSMYSHTVYTLLLSSAFRLNSAHFFFYSANVKAKNSKSIADRTKSK